MGWREYPSWVLSMVFCHTPDYCMNDIYVRISTTHLPPPSPGRRKRRGQLSPQEQADPPLLRPSLTIEQFICNRTFRRPAGCRERQDVQSSSPNNTPPTDCRRPHPRRLVSESTVYHHHSDLLTITRFLMTSQLPLQPHASLHVRTYLVL